MPHPRNWRITDSPSVNGNRGTERLHKLPKVTRPVKGITARVLKPLDSSSCEKEEFGTQVWKLAWLQSLKRVILQTQGPLGQIANGGSARKPEGLMKPFPEFYNLILTSLEIGT